MQDKHKKILRYAVVIAAVAFASKSYWLNKPDKDSKTIAVAANVKVDASRKLGSLKFEPCSLSQGGESVSAFCSTLQVPEDHSKPKGRKITLAISWLPAKNEAEADPDRKSVV